LRNERVSFSRRVVADDDHQVDAIAQRQLEAIAQLLQHARAAHLPGFGQREFVAPFGFTLGHAGEGFDHDGDFDRAGRADALVGVAAVAFARVEILCEQPDLAFEIGEGNAHLCVEC
jgi:hypothetical protein